MWNHERRNGKWTKVPYRVDGRTKARSDDPRTWGTFVQAIARTESTRTPAVSRDGRQLDLSTKEFGVPKRSLRQVRSLSAQKSHESGEDASPTRARG